MGWVTKQGRHQAAQGGKAMRIAVGGIRHESNTFSPLHTEYTDFWRLYGADAQAEGATALAAEQGAELVPTLVAYAYPGGVVRAAAYRRLKDELLAALEAALPVDGVYLDLHGAMHVEGVGDGETDLSQAVRDLVGPEVPISVSLDLHGNISPALVANVNALTALRTAPHRDGTETRCRALALLVRAIREGLDLEPVLIKVPLLLSGEAVMTDVEPARSLYARLPAMAQEPGILDASLLVGCAWTDGPYTTASVIVVGAGDAHAARKQAQSLARDVWAARHAFRFGHETAPPEEAVSLAVAAAEAPVYITDSGDNVTAGGAGDTTWMLQALLAQGAQDALVAGLFDPVAVERCAEAGVGSALTLAIGGRCDPQHHASVTVTGRVQHLGRGAHEGDGAPTMATLVCGGVTVVVCVDRRPFAERATIAQAGVDPDRCKIVVVKQGYLFPDLVDHAPRVIMALTPGATDLELERLPYRHVPRPIYPLDRGLAWKPCCASSSTGNR